jgi:hypothetical protein
MGLVAVKKRPVVSDYLLISYNEISDYCYYLGPFFQFKRSLATIKTLIEDCL